MSARRPELLDFICLRFARRHRNPLCPRGAAAVLRACLCAEGGKVKAYCSVQRCDRGTTAQLADIREYFSTSCKAKGLGQASRRDLRLSLPCRDQLLSAWS